MSEDCAGQSVDCANLTEIYRVSGYMYGGNLCRKIAQDNRWIAQL